MTDFSAQQGSELQLKLKRLGVISTAFQQSAIPSRPLAMLGMFHVEHSRTQSALDPSPMSVPRGTFELPV
jgi:hypothetical protein